MSGEAIKEKITETFTSKPTSFWIRSGIKILVVVVLVIILKNLFYLYKEFIINVNVYNEPRNRSADRLHIPQHIHQVFFSKEIPENFRQAQATCKEVHREYQYTFWTKDMVDTLIDEHYPNIRELFQSYPHWVNRADVARYVIISRFGGIYLDMDTKCKQSVEGIRQEVIKQNKSFAVRSTTPWGIASDFFGAPRQHPFLDSVIQALPQSYRWYLIPHFNTLLSTGPTFFWGRYLNYERKDEFLIVDDFEEYMDPNHARTWHSVDSKIIWHFQNHAQHLRIFTYFLVFIVTLFVMCVFYRYCFKPKLTPSSNCFTSSYKSL